MSRCSNPSGRTKKKCGQYGGRLSFSRIFLAHCLVDEEPLLQRFLVTAGVEEVHQKQSTCELVMLREMTHLYHKTGLAHRKSHAKPAPFNSNVQNDAEARASTSFSRKLRCSEGVT